MKARKTWWRWLVGSADDRVSSVIDILGHRYVREKQQAMRYSQHAERMRYPQFREALLRIASEEEKHAGLIEAKIKALGGKLPDVIPIHAAKESNSWQYLRTDLEEEQRCAGELHEDLPGMSGEFPDVAKLLERIEEDGKDHRSQLRDMIARSDPQSLWPA
jgi:rubrerythrin